MKRFFWLMIAVLGLNACASPGTQTLPANAPLPAGVTDWRNSKHQICQVHRVPMQTKIVYDTDASIQFDEEYAEASAKLFPNGDISYGPELYSKNRGAIYVCPDCVEAEKVWTEKHR